MFLMREGKGAMFLMREGGHVPDEGRGRCS